jgi:hypothetical protein
MGILIYVYDADTKHIPKGILKGSFEGIWEIF